jgi:hypothetical protein
MIAFGMGIGSVVLRAGEEVKHRKCRERTMSRPGQPKGQHEQGDGTNRAHGLNP